MAVPIKRRPPGNERDGKQEDQLRASGEASKPPGTCTCQEWQNLAGEVQAAWQTGRCSLGVAESLQDHLPTAGLESEAEDSCWEWWPFRTHPPGDKQPAGCQSPTEVTSPNVYVLPLPY